MIFSVLLIDEEMIESVGVTNIFPRFPRWFVITEPMNEELEGLFFSIGWPFILSIYST